jgi:hypothetical protein
MRNELFCSYLSKDISDIEFSSFPCACVRFCEIFEQTGNWARIGDASFCQAELIFVFYSLINSVVKTGIEQIAACCQGT